jgi:hypothetical protein
MLIIAGWLVGEIATALTGGIVMGAVSSDGVRLGESLVGEDMTGDV